MVWKTTCRSVQNMLLFSECSSSYFLAVCMQCTKSFLKVYAGALRKLNIPSLNKSNSNNTNIVKILNLMELGGQNPTCKCKVFPGMPLLTHMHMHAHTVSWKGCHWSTLINHLWELKTAAQGKICNVQTANSKSKQPTNQKLDLANGLVFDPSYLMEMWHLRHD